VLAESDLGRWLGTVVAGKPACVFSDDVVDARNTLEQLVTSEQTLARVLALSWEDVPALGNELALLVAALAKATLELFPSLYGAEQAPGGRWTEAEIETATHEVTRRLPDVFGPACRQILSACHRGQVPALPKLSNSEQARQLALAIEPHRLVVVIAVLNPALNAARMRALAQGAEWLAMNTGSRVVLALPTACRSVAELDHVSYAACVFVKQALEAETTSQPVETRALGRDGLPSAEKITAPPPHLFVSAAVGRPHPRSEAEQELHRRLALDAELGTLFSYNQPVPTRYATAPTVDLLWEAQRLVIEVDGNDHRGPQKFSQDRRRDYELVMSGYTVLRFTSSRVLEDPETVINEIRDAVRHFGGREKE